MTVATSMDARARTGASTGHPSTRAAARVVPMVIAVDSEIKLIFKSFLTKNNGFFVQ